VPVNRTVVRQVDGIAAIWLDRPDIIAAVEGDERVSRTPDRESGIGIRHKRSNIPAVGIHQVQEVAAVPSAAERNSLTIG
jgi:hypothetical protein